MKRITQIALIGLVLGLSIASCTSHQKCAAYGKVDTPVQNNNVGS